MKLSMWILNSELSRKYATIPLILDGERTIENARLFLSEEETASSAEYVYIGKASDFFMGDAADVLLSSGRDMLFVRNGDILEVVHNVLRIFDKYREFEEKLIRAGMGENPFQEMLDVIHGLFQCPMFCGQKDLRILALTDQYTDEQVYEGWDEVKKYYTMPITLINTTVAPDMEKYPDTIPTVAIPVAENEGKHFKYQIRSNIYCNREFWGHLYIYYYQPVMSMSVIQLARYCADAYGSLLDRLALIDSADKHKKYTFLMDMLDGKTVEKEKIENLSWQMGWAAGQQLRLYRITLPRESKSEVFFDFACAAVDKSAVNEIVFVYQRQILVIGKDTGRKPAEPFLSLKRVMSDDKYICGVSYPFSDMRMLTYAYFQAGFAIEKYYSEHPASNYSYYDDYAFAGLIAYVRQATEYKAFISPALVKLYEIDRVTGTEYYKTLFWLLVNNYHAAETAKTLFIHRNTLKYRVDKITQLMDVDIYDGDISAYLRFCYALMLEDFPPDVGDRTKQQDEPGE